MDKYIDKQYLIANLKAFKNQILDPKYASLGEDGKISKAVVPSLSAAEVGALPEDTEIPIFTNKAVLDKISEEKVESWDEAVTAAHTHDNKIVLDKFSENDEGKVLYDNKPLASDNLWHGTQAEYGALGEYDENKTYVITDGGEEADLSDVMIDDTSTTATNKTWSSNKISSQISNCAIPQAEFDMNADINLNDYRSTGYWNLPMDLVYDEYKHTILNGPDAPFVPAGGFGLDVRRYGSSYCTQILYVYNNGNAVPQTYQRCSFYGDNVYKWTAWKKVAYSN